MKPDGGPFLLQRARKTPQRNPPLQADSSFEQPSCELTRRDYIESTPYGMLGGTGMSTLLFGMSVLNAATFP